MATTISAGTNPYKLGSPPDFGTLYSGRALEFDGVTDYIENTSPSGLPSGDTFTVSAWVKDAGGANFFVIWRRDNATDNPIVRLVGTSRELEIRMLGRETITADTGLTPNVWHHVVVSIDNLVVTFYVDGVQDGSGTFTVSNFIHANEWNTGWYQSAQYSNGELANLQVWDRAWSESDVQYAYTHPEKLITDNSAVTSGTTISNLKLWLPCTEGNPRSPQTTVYDGSPKELGSELITGFTNGSTYPFDTFTTSGQDISSAIETSGDWGGCASNSFSITSGVMYKCTFNLTYNSGDDTLRVVLVDAASGGDTQRSNIFYTNTNGVNTTYLIATATDADAHLQLGTWHSSDEINFSATDISLKEVKMGNHGTTTFYGDELITNGDMELDSSWYNESSPTTNERSSTQAHAGTYSRKYVGNSTADGLRTSFFSLTAGATYTVSLWYYLETGSPGQLIRMQDGDGNNLGTYIAVSTKDAWTEVTFERTATVTGSSAHVKIYQNGAGDTTCYIDDWSVKEIGVADGWTTADAEPLIPQTALMGMSKPMVFDGVDDYVNIDGVVTDVASDTNGTISAWIVSHEDNSANIRFLSFGDTNANEYIYLAIISGLLTAKMKTAGGGNRWVLDTDATFNHTSALNHVVLTQDGTEPVLYINGTKPAQAFSTSTDKTEWFADASGIDNGRLGCYNQNSEGNTYFASVDINEVSVWNDDFTLAEVQELFNDGVPLDATEHSKEANLKGYWRNDGASSWSDRQDNVTANNGTPAGSPDTILLPEGTTSGKDILGFPLTHTNNGWLNFSGSEYVDAGDSSVLDIRSAITIEAWIKPAIIDQVGYFITRDDTSNRNWSIYLYSDEYIYWDIYLDGGNKKETKSTTQVVAGTWYHVVGTYDGSNQKLYINGSLEDNDAETGNLDNDDVSLAIGSQEDGLNAFYGSIDEARVYNRALTLAEVTKNYKHGLSKHS